MNLFRVSRGICLFIVLLGFASASFAQNEEDASVEYVVRITNLTKGQPFSRIVVATHRPGVDFFELGSPAPPALVALAEEGNFVPLAARLASLPDVRDVAVTPGALAPGDTVVVRIRGGGPHTRVSVAGKLLVTNDGFFALSGARIPALSDRRTHFPPALDAGSEANDEQCTSIPTPPCDGEGGIPGEGFVHVHNGVHGIGDLEPARRDFRNPVARIQIFRVDSSGATDEEMIPN